MLEEELEKDLDELSDTEDTDDDFDFTLTSLRPMARHSTSTNTTNTRAETGVINHHADASSVDLGEDSDVDFDREMMDLAASTTFRMSSLAPIKLPAVEITPVATNDSLTKTESRGGLSTVTSVGGKERGEVINPTDPCEDSDGSATPKTALTSSSQQISAIPVMDEVTLRLELQELMQDMFFSIEHIAELAVAIEREKLEAAAAALEAGQGGNGNSDSSSDASFFLAAGLPASISSSVYATSGTFAGLAIPSPLFEINDDTDIASYLNSNNSAGNGDNSKNSSNHDESDAATQEIEAQSVTSLSDNARGVIDTMSEQQRQHRELMDQQLKLQASQMQAEIQADLEAREKRKLKRQAEMLKARKLRAALTLQCKYRCFKAIKMLKWKKYTADRLNKERALVRLTESIWEMVNQEILRDEALQAAEYERKECERVVLEEQRRLEEAEAERQRVVAQEQEQVALRRERQGMCVEERLMMDLHAHWCRVEQARQQREWSGMQAEDQRAGEPVRRKWLTTTLKMGRKAAEAAAEVRRQKVAAERESTMTRLQMQFRGANASITSTTVATAAVAAVGSSGCFSTTVGGTRVPTPPPFSAAFGGFVSSVKKIVGAVTSGGGGSAGTRASSSFSSTTTTTAVGVNGQPAASMSTSPVNMSVSMPHSSEISSTVDPVYAQTDQALIKVIEGQNKQRIDDENALERVLSSKIDSVVFQPQGKMLASGLPPLPSHAGSITTSDASIGGGNVCGSNTGAVYSNQNQNLHATAVTTRLVQMTLLLSLQQWRDYWVAAPHDRFYSIYLAATGSSSRSSSSDATASSNGGGVAGAMSVRHHISTAWGIRHGATILANLGEEDLSDVTVNVAGADGAESISDIIQKQCSYSGGKDREKVCKLDATGSKLVSLTGVDALTSLQELLCGQNRILDISALPRSPCCSSLRVLKLDGNRLNDRSWADVIGTSANSVRTSTHNNNNASNCNSQPMFPCLETLSLNGNQFTMLPDFSTHFPLLSRLDLGHNQISCCYGYGYGYNDNDNEGCAAADGNVNSLKHLASLTYLNLGRNRLTYIDGGLFSYSCPLLTTLILSQNQLTSLPCQLFLVHLKELRLNDNKLTHLNHWRLSVPAAVSVTGGPLLSMQSIPVFLPMLERLYLHDNSIEFISSTSLIGVSYNLRVLDLSFNNISRLDCAQGLRVCQRLQHLLIHDNPIHALFVRKDTTQCVIDVLPCVSALLSSDDAETGTSGGGGRMVREDQQWSVLSSQPRPRPRVHASTLLQCHLDAESGLGVRVFSSYMYPYAPIDGDVEGGDSGHRTLELPPSVLLGLLPEDELVSAENSSSENSSSSNLVAQPPPPVQVVSDSSMVNGGRPPPLYNPLLGPVVDHALASEGQTETVLLDGYSRAYYQQRHQHQSQKLTGSNWDAELDPSLCAGTEFQVIASLMNAQDSHRSLQHDLQRRRTKDKNKGSGAKTDHASYKDSSNNGLGGIAGTNANNSSSDVDNSNIHSQWVTGDITFGSLVLYVEGMRQLLWHKLDAPTTGVDVDVDTVSAVASAANEVVHGDGARETKVSSDGYDDGDRGGNSLQILQAFLSADVVVLDEEADGQIVRRLVVRKDASPPTNKANQSSMPAEVAAVLALATPEITSSFCHLQAAFRGHKVRERLRRLLESVEYRDDEMDAILYRGKRGTGDGRGGDGRGDDDEFGLEGLDDVDAFMNELLGGGGGTSSSSGGGGGAYCPELDDNWLTYKKPSAASASSVKTSRLQQYHYDDGDDDDLDKSDSQQSQQNTMVYGDHIKKRRSQSGGAVSGADSGDMTGSLSSGGVGLLHGQGGGPAGRSSLVSYPPPLVHLSSVGAVNVVGIGGAADREKITVAAWGSTAASSAATSRPISAMTDADQSEFGDRDSGGGNKGKFSLPLPVSEFHAHNATVGAMSSSRSTKSHQSAASSSSDIAQEWGISDPVVLATIMKRNQKMR